MCCCCCGVRLHRHQVHLISYGCVSFGLIATGLVFTVFAIFQKDSQIGKVWLAGPTTMVVGLVLCGKVVIDYSPAMLHGREGSIDSRLDQFTLSNPLTMLNGDSNYLKAPLHCDNLTPLSPSAHQQQQKMRRFSHFGSFHSMVGQSSGEMPNQPSGGAITGVRNSLLPPGQQVPRHLSHSHSHTQSQSQQRGPKQVSRYSLAAPTTYIPTAAVEPSSGSVTVVDIEEGGPTDCIVYGQLFDTTSNKEMAIHQHCREESALVASDRLRSAATQTTPLQRFILSPAGSTANHLPALAQAPKQPPPQMRDGATQCCECEAEAMIFHSRDTINYGSMAPTTTNSANSAQRTFNDGGGYEEQQQQGLYQGEEFVLNDRSFLV